MSMVPTTAAIISDLRTTGQLNAIAKKEGEVIQVDPGWLARLRQAAHYHRTKNRKPQCRLLDWRISVSPLVLFNNSEIK